MLRSIKLGAFDTGSILSPSLVERKLLVGAGFKPALINEERSNVPFCQDRPKAGLYQRLRGNNEQGSTLLESLIATLLLNIMLSAAAGELCFINRSWSRQYDRQEELYCTESAVRSLPNLIYLQSVKKHQASYQFDLCQDSLSQQSLQIICSAKLELKPEQIFDCQVSYLRGKTDRDNPTKPFSLLVRL